MENQIQSISIELTDKCNLICKHCSTKASPIGNTFLDEKSIKKVLLTGKEFEAKKLTLSGGEPLLHPQLIDILEYANYLKYEIYLYSSGVLEGKKSLNRELLEILKKYINTIIFSIYSNNKKNHDKVTQVEDSYEITIKSIKRALASGIKTEVHTVPMSINYKNIFDIIKILDSLGVNKISLLRLVPQGRCIENRNLLMTKKQSLEFLNIVKNIEKDRDNVFIRKGAPYKCLFQEEAAVCSAGKDKILISPNGDIHPCEAFKSDKSVSNIKEKNLHDIWHNDKRLNEIRSLDLKQISACRDCENINSCMGGCPGQRWLANKDIKIGPDPGCVINTNL